MLQNDLNDAIVFYVTDNPLTLIENCNYIAGLAK